MLEKIKQWLPFIVKSLILVFLIPSISGCFKAPEYEGGYKAPDEGFRYPISALLFSYLFIALCIGAIYVLIKCNKYGITLKDYFNSEDDDYSETCKKSSKLNVKNTKPKENIKMFKGQNRIYPYKRRKRKLDIIGDKDNLSFTAQHKGNRNCRKVSKRKAGGKENAKLNTENTKLKADIEMLKEQNNILTNKINELTCDTTAKGYRKRHPSK